MSMQVNSQSIVVKYGGAVLEYRDLRESFLKQILELQNYFRYVFLVHGGGKALTREMERQDICVEFIDGIRKSSSEVVFLAQKVFKNLNDEIVTLLEKLGCTSVFSVTDGKGLYGSLMRPEEPTDLVGTIDFIDKNFFQDSGIYVISSIIRNGDFKEQKSFSYLNINADLLATGLAISFNVQYLIFISDVNGIYLNKEDQSTLIKQATTKEVLKLIEQGVLEGGMKVKICTALDAIKRGVKKVFFINGTSISNLYQCIYGKENTGTQLLQ